MMDTSRSFAAVTPAPGARGKTFAALGFFLILLLALLPFMRGSAFYYTLGILICIQSLLALSMHLMLRIGQLSLAQAGFMGIGAYTSALLTRDYGTPFLLALTAAALAPAIVAALLSPVILRARGVQFVLLTFALGQVITLMFIQWTVPFGGNSGFMGIPAARFFIWSLKSKSAFYGFVLVLVGLTNLGAWLLLRGRASFVFRGLLGNEALMQSLGVNVPLYRRYVFAVSAAVAGLAGSCYAHFLGFISPDAFGVMTSVNALVMNVLGGTSFLTGPLLGATLLVPLPELFRDSIVFLQLSYGIALIVLMVFLPRGLAGLIQRVAASRLGGDRR